MSWSISYRPIPSGLTALADYVQNHLADGAWGTLTMNGLDRQWDAGGSGFIPYGPIGQWNPLTKKFAYIGGTHPNDGSIYQTRQFDYTDSTNTWLRDDVVIPPGDGNFDHGYYNTALNPTNGDLYHYQYGGPIYKRAAGASTWTVLPASPVQYNITNPTVWHPGLFSGAGGLLTASSFGVAAWNGSTWTTLYSASNTFMGEHTQVGIYNPTDGCAYFGGGNVGAFTNNMWKVTATGTVSLITPPPIPVGADTGSPSPGLAPLYASTSGNNMVIVPGQGSGTTTIYEYNATLNTWPSVSTRPFTFVDSFAGFTCSTYGCLVFIRPDSGVLMSSTAYIWKR